MKPYACLRSYTFNDDVHLPLKVVVLLALRMQECVDTSRVRDAEVPSVHEPKQLAVDAPTPAVPMLAENEFEFVFKNGEYVPKAMSQHNIQVASRRLHARLAYNEFDSRVYVEWHLRAAVHIQHLDDIVEGRIWLLIDKYFNFLPPRSFFAAVLLDEAQNNRYHPVREYLNGLNWDGQPRVDDWLVRYAGAEDTPFVKSVSAIMLIAAVRRVRQPGCKFDEIAVFESPQGKDKSSALQALCPDPTWFTDCLPLNATPKQVIEQTTGKWIVEVAELSGISGAEVEQLKAMLSRQVDAARPAYGRHRIDLYRQWVAFGTTNDSEYLRDDTGNRRFWPITVQKFDVPRILGVRDQLWAEAAAREAKGESVRLPENLWQDAAKEQEQRFVVDPWEDELTHIFSKHQWPGGLKRVTRRDLYGWLGKSIASSSKRDGMRLKAVMKRIGWRAMAVTDPLTRKVEWGYGCDP